MARLVFEPPVRGGFDASGGGIDTGYDPSSSWAATDIVTDYYTDADW